MNRKTIVFCVFLVVVLTVPCFPLMLKLSLEELNSGADLIAIGKVVQKECRWGEKPRWIYTYVTLAVDEYIKGEGGKQVIVRHIGGEVGGKGLIAGGMPRFRQGEEVLVFLGKAEDNSAALDMRGDTRGIYRVCGFAQGKYEIFEDETGTRMVRNNFSNLCIRDAGKVKILNERVLPGKPLSEFILEIKGILSEIDSLRSQ